MRCCWVITPAAVKFDMLALIVRTDRDVYSASVARFGKHRPLLSAKEQSATKTILSAAESSGRCKTLVGTRAHLSKNPHLAYVGQYADSGGVGQNLSPYAHVMLTYKNVFIRVFRVPLNVTQSVIHIVRNA